MTTVRANASRSTTVGSPPGACFTKIHQKFHMIWYWFEKIHYTIFQNICIVVMQFMCFFKKIWVCNMVGTILPKSINHISTVLNEMNNSVFDSTRLKILHNNISCKKILSRPYPNEARLGSLKRISWEWNLAIMTTNFMFKKFSL